MIVIGVIWIVAAFALNLFGKTAAADNLTADLKPAFTDASIQQYERDAATVVAFDREIQDVTVPFLSEQLGMTPKEVAGILTSNYPAVGRVLSPTDNSGAPYADGRPYLDHAADYMTGVATALEANQANFNAASNIPASFLPTKVVAVLFLLLGILGVLIGWRVWSTPGPRSGIALVAGLGIIVIVAPLVLGLLGKTAKLDTLMGNWEGVFTYSGPASITEGQAYLTAVRAADVELETKVVRDLPDLLGAKPDAVVEALKANSPVVATGLLEKDSANPEVSVVGGILDRWDALAGVVHDNISDFQKTDDIPGLGLAAKLVPWLLIGPGLLLLLSAYFIWVPGAVGVSRHVASDKELASV